MGFGILSWHGYETLAVSLATYPAEGFLDLFNERVIFFPEITEQGRQLADRFGFRAEGQAENRGIMDGFRGLTSTMASETVVLVENDCPLIEAAGEAQAQVERAVSLLEENRAIVVRLRSRRDPGEAFDTVEKYRRMYPAAEASMMQRTYGAALQRLRPDKAQRLIGTAPYVEPEPARRFPSVISDIGDGFYLTPTAVTTWTNQSIAINRRFFLDTIIARADQINDRRTVNGFKNLEIEINGQWWRSQPWAVAIAPGIFTHRRLGWRGY